MSKDLRDLRLGIYAGVLVILDFLWLYIVAGNIFIYKRSFINLFLMPKVFTVNMVGFLLPVLPLLFIFAKSSEVHTDGIKNCLVIALSAPIMCAFAYLTELLVYWIIDPSIKALAFPPDGLFSSVLEMNPFGYIILYILHICAWGYVLTLIGLAVYQRTENQFYAVITAFLLSRFPTYIPIVFGSIRITVLGYIIPQLPYEISQMNDNWCSDLTQILTIFLISIVLMKCKKK